MVRRIFSNTFTLLIVGWFVAAAVIIAMNPQGAEETFYSAFAYNSLDDTTAADSKTAADRQAPADDVANLKDAADSREAANRKGIANSKGTIERKDPAASKDITDSKDATNAENTTGAQTSSAEPSIWDFLGQLSEGEGHAAAMIKFVRDRSLAQWFIFFSFIFAGWLLGRIVAAILASIGRRMSGRGWTARAHLPADLASPAWLAIFTLGLNAGLASLTIYNFAEIADCNLLRLLYSIAAFWYVYNLVGVVEAGLTHLGDATKLQVDEQLIGPIRKSLRILVVIVAVLFIVSKVFNQDVSAWLAGLGIAGLAVSLAAQDSLKNLFGSITILADRPFRVGERIVYSGYDGVIEEIGFRSTTVRTGDGHLVSIPNSAIVNGSVENIGRRPFIKRTMNVTITYDTPKDKIEEAVEILRKILEEDGISEPIHKSVGMNDYPPRVFFNDMTADSLNIIVIYWYMPPAYWDYLDHAQRVNLRIFEEFERADIDFSFPTQTLYLVGDEKRRLAVEMLGRDLK